MGWFDRLRKTAEDAAARLSSTAEQAARYVAEQGPGFVGEGAAEMLAERDWRRARAMAEAGLDRGTAAEVIALLEPHQWVDSDYALLLGGLLAQAYQAVGRLDEATATLTATLAKLRDPLVRRSAAAVLVEEQNQVAEEFEIDLLVSLASAALAAGDYGTCIRRSMEARGVDEHALTAYYLEGVAMLRHGFAPEAVAELWARAMVLGGGETVVGWVRELLPDHLPWFEGRVG